MNPSVKPSSSGARTYRGRGFTLIELMVVLVIVTLTGAFVGPNVWRQYTKFSERSVIDSINHDLLELRREAHVSGKSILVNHQSSLVRDALPEGWELETMTPIYFLPSGVTSGGQLKFITASGSRWQLNLSPLDGKAEIEIQ